MKKLYKVWIRTYYFGNLEYNLYVRADNKDEAISYIYKCDRFRKDEDAEILDVGEIDMSIGGIC